MNNDEGVLKFQRLLKLRGILKSVSQITWNLAQLERRYPLESATDNEIESLLNAYKAFINELIVVLSTEDLNYAIGIRKLTRGLKKNAKSTA